MIKYKLESLFNSQKSFYGKANIESENGKKTLISYNTKVCFIENNKAFVNGLYSNTTTRHIKEFLKQNGFKAEDSKQILKDYSEKETTKEQENQLKTIGLIASLGEMFGDSQKQKNDWKKKMLVAGLENKGLSFPEDWETLSEKEKEKRLNGVIEITK